MRAAAGQAAEKAVSRLLYRGGMGRTRWFGWWYAAIGAGFVLLAANRLLLGYRDWTIPLRFVIAAGFLALAWIHLRPRRL